MGHIKHINEEIGNAIQFRYINVRRASSGFYINDTSTRKLIGDTYLPNMVLEMIRDSKTIEGGLKDIVQLRNSAGESSTPFYTISELATNMMKSSKLSIEDMVKMLGYTKTDISKILRRVKKRQHRLILIGAGGTGSNFLHWTYEMMSMVGLTSIFGLISVFDNEKYDTTNILRLPFIPEVPFDPRLMVDGYKVDMLPKRFEALADYKFERIPVKITKYSLIENAGEIYYGAPDLETRNIMREIKSIFITGTHKDNKYNLTLVPDEVEDGVIEGYGKIELANFFINQLDMAIEFLKFLTRSSYDIAELARDAAENGQYEIVAGRDAMQKNNFEDISAPSVIQLRAGSKRPIGFDFTLLERAQIQFTM